MHKTKVTCTCCLGQNNLKIINLFYKRSQEHQTNFQIMMKYYISLGSKRDLGWFGEFPHIENSILVLAVNCCIYKLYANYVSKFFQAAFIHYKTVQGPTLHNFRRESSTLLLGMTVCDVGIFTNATWVHYLVRNELSIFFTWCREINCVVSCFAL